MLRAANNWTWNEKNHKALTAQVDPKDQDPCQPILENPSESVRSDNIVNMIKAQKQVHAFFIVTILFKV